MADKRWQLLGGLCASDGEKRCDWTALRGWIWFDGLNSQGSRERRI